MLPAAPPCANMCFCHTLHARSRPVRCLCMAGSSRSRAEPAVGLRVELLEDTEVGWLEVGKVGRRSAEGREIHPPSQRTGPLSYPALYDGGGSRCSTWKAVDADRGRDEQGSAQSGILGAVGSGTVGMCGVRGRGRVAANGPSSQRPQPAELARSWLGQHQLRIAYRHAAAHAHHRQPEPRTPVRPYARDPAPSLSSRLGSPEPESTSTTRTRTRDRTQSQLDYIALTQPTSCFHTLPLPSPYPTKTNSHNGPQPPRTYTAAPLVMTRPRRRPSDNASHRDGLPPLPRCRARCSLRLSPVRNHDARALHSILRHRANATGWCRYWQEPSCPHGRRQAEQGEYCAVCLPRKTQLGTTEFTSVWGSASRDRAQSARQSAV